LVLAFFLLAAVDQHNWSILSLALFIVPSATANTLAQESFESTIRAGKMWRDQLIEQTKTARMRVGKKKDRNPVDISQTPKASEN
jgi:hypothetical protein